MSFRTGSVQHFESVHGAPSFFWGFDRTPPCAGVLPAGSMALSGGTTQLILDNVILTTGNIKFDNGPATETLLMVLAPGNGSPSGQQVAAAFATTKVQMETIECSIETASTRGFVLEADSQPRREAECAAWTAPVAVQIKLEQ